MKNWHIIFLLIIAVCCKPYDRIFLNTTSIEGFLADSCELYLIVSSIDSLNIDNAFNCSSVYEDLITFQDFRKCDYMEKKSLKPSTDTSFFLKTVRQLEVKGDTAYIERLYKLSEITDSVINVLCYSREFVLDGANHDKPFMKTNISISINSEEKIKIKLGSS